MQPAHNGATGQKSSLKRYGPVIGLVAAVGIGAGAVALTGGDDKAAPPITASLSSSAKPTTTDPATTDPAANDPTVTDPPPTGGTSPESTPAGPSAPVAEVTFPLSFSDAKEGNIAVDWGARCDVASGRVATADFFAPECYAPFVGENGGTTSPGVTPEEITVVYYQGITGDPIIDYITDAVKADDTHAQQEETMRNMLRYFETYYETYGRKVNLVVVEGSGNALDEVAARADAVRIAKDIKPFMVWGGPALTNAFADELAANKVMCLSCTPAQPPEWFTERDPYIWGIDGGAEQKQVHVLEFVQKQLLGKPATHAGEQFVATERTFGYIYVESGANSKVLAETFAAGMTDIGAPLVETLPYTLDPGTLQQAMSQAVAKLKASGVTTVLFNGDPVAPREFTKEATAQGYFPEWVIAAATLTDLNAFARTYDQEQWKHAFGVTTLAARVTPEISGYYALHTWFTGTEPPANDTIGTFIPAPAVFYAVLQNVGPVLTPETWRDGLFSYNATRSAISQPSLSWGDKGIWPQPDYAGIDDATVIWWDPTATGPDELRKQGTGMYQFVDGGKRYMPGNWPAEDKLFVSDGAVALYNEAPPGEAPPDFPSPAVD